MYCQFVIVVLLSACMNLIFKILWKIIVDKTKEYLDSQYNTLQQNTQSKQKQLKKLQMSARKQISMEVKDTAKPIVLNLAKQNVLSLLKGIVPAAVKESLNDILHIQQVPDNDKFLSSLSGVSSDSVPVECAKSISLDVVDGFKEFKSKRANTSAKDTIKKFAKEIQSRTERSTRRRVVW